MKCKSGFGILEVLVAALVLGFLIVGLTQLQKGNREAVLRIRARDVAQAVAIDVIDNLRRTGLSSVDITADDSPMELEVERTFEGAVGQSKINYRVKVFVSEGENETYKSNEQSGLTRAKSSSVAYTNELAYEYAKKVDVFVDWDFKNSVQSIQVSEVIK